MSDAPRRSFQRFHAVSRYLQGITQAFRNDAAGLKGGWTDHGQPRACVIPDARFQNSMSMVRSFSPSPMTKPSVVFKISVSFVERVGFSPPPSRAAAAFSAVASA